MKKISGNPYLQKDNDKLIIDQVPFEYFSENFKTPIMIFLENKIKSNIQSFVKIFKSYFNNLQCFYSFKANFLPEICKIIQNQGIGAEIVGLPELKVALKVGFSPEKIIVGGPYLSTKLLKTSIKNKVKEIIVYSLNDLKKIDSIAKQYNHIQDICIRVNSQKYESRLGVDLNKKNLEFLEREKNKLENLNIKTILSHFSTQMNNIKLFKRNINTIVENLEKLNKIGISIKNLNFGGGFPEATIMTDKQLDFVAQEIKNLLDDLTISYESIYFEPGRYLVGDAGIFIAKIVQIKEKRWLFLNVGNHICPKFSRASLRFYNASRISESHKYKTSFSGIIPTDQDILAKDYFFPEINSRGDKIIITNVGAYCLTFSNRFPYTLPSIFLVNGKESKQIFNPNLEKDFSLS